MTSARDLPRRAEDRVGDRTAFRFDQQRLDVDAALARNGFRLRQNLAPVRAQIVEQRVDVAGGHITDVAHVGHAAMSSITCTIDSAAFWSDARPIAALSPRFPVGLPSIATSTCVNMTILRE